MKRIRKYKESPNPLFEKWLEEWKQEAIARDSPIQHSFGKALASLRKYPLPLASGKDCQILQNFGQKLCSMLDKKLSQYNAIHGINSISTQSCSAYDEEIGGKKQKKDQQEKVPEIDDNHVNKNRKNKTAAKPYIPKIGTGAYAIMITFYRNMQNDNYPGFMYKKDIMSEAQENCDVSMKGTATDHYGGWSSMTTLISKQLIKKESKPAKYSLTDAGIALALALWESRSRHSHSSDDDNIELASDQQNFKISQIQSKASPLKCKNVESKSIEEKCGSQNIITASQYRSQSKHSSSLEENVNQKSPVHLDLTGDDSSPLRINQSVTKEIQDIVFINDDDDNVFNDSLTVKTAQIKLNSFEKIERRNSDAKSTCSSEEAFSNFCKENVESMITVRKKVSHFIFTESLDCPKSTLDENNSKMNVQDTNVLPECSTKKTACEAKKGKVTKKGTKNAISSSQKKTMNSVDDEPIQPFFLLPNNFDVILLVDTQETSGGKTRPKDDATISELSKAEALFEVRSLKVGDFAWIARCRFTNRELVLPYIVERKRMDDLCSSIRDGRYHEQKFRLRQSGIKNVIYMIENYGKNYHGAIPLTSLLQAGVNSLVQDNFTVKYTRDHKNSMRYLASMTTMLTKIYEGKELTCRSKNDLELMNSDDSESLYNLMEFTEFNKASVKTKNFKVRDMLIRQLLQLKGVSVEKAVAIAEVYPTPKLLAGSLKKADEKLLANIEAGPSKRKIGPALSKTIYQLYTRYSLT